MNKPSNSCNLVSSKSDAVPAPVARCGKRIAFALLACVAISVLAGCETTSGSKYRGADAHKLFWPAQSSTHPGMLVAIDGVPVTPARAGSKMLAPGQHTFTHTDWNEVIGTRTSQGGRPEVTTERIDRGTSVTKITPAGPTTTWQGDRVVQRHFQWTLPAGGSTFWVKLYSDASNAGIASNRERDAAKSRKPPGTRSVSGTMLTGYTDGQGNVKKGTTKRQNVTLDYSVDSHGVIHIKDMRGPGVPASTRRIIKQQAQSP